MTQVQFFDKDEDEVVIEDGEIKRIELNLHNGDVDLSAGRYNPESGKWEMGVVARTVFNIYRVAYQDSKGDYDLMLQPYIPLSPRYQINDYIEDIKVRYKRVMEKDQKDNANEVIADVHTFLTRYIESVETGATDLLWDMMLNDGTSTAIRILEEQLGVKKGIEEIQKFYYDYYDGELISFGNQLKASYGDYSISYEIRDANEYTGELLKEIIDAYAQYGIKNVDAMIALNVAFTVKGGDKEDVITDSFLYPNMSLVRIAGTWKLLTPDGFAKPGVEELREFLGLD